MDVWHGELIRRMRVITVSMLKGQWSPKALFRFADAQEQGRKPQGDRSPEKYPTPGQRLESFPGTNRSPDESRPGLEPAIVCS